MPRRALKNPTLEDDHPLGPVLPISSKMTGPMTLLLEGLDGIKLRVRREVFKTRVNVFILLYPVRALTSNTILLPAGFQRHFRN